MTHRLPFLAVTLGLAAPAWAQEPVPDAVPAPTDIEGPEEPGSDEPEDAREARLEALDARRLGRVEEAYQQRTLGHFPFVEAALLDSALPASHLGSSLGAAAVINPFDDGTTSTYVAGRGRLDGGARFGKWVAIDGEIGGAAGLGARGEALLDAGALAVWDWSAGVNVRLVQGETTALSIRPSGFGQRGTVASVGPGLSELMRQAEAGEAVDFVEATRFMTANVATLGGLTSLNLAQSFGRHVGIQATVTGGVERSRVRYYDGVEQEDTSVEGLLAVGGALGFDTNPVPLAIQLEYRYDHVFGTGVQRGLSGFGHNVGFGLFLNGMTNTIGLQATAALGGGQVDVGADLDFRSYF